MVITPVLLFNDLVSNYNKKMLQNSVRGEIQSFTGPTGSILSSCFVKDVFLYCSRTLCSAESSACISWSSYFSLRFSCSCCCRERWGSGQRLNTEFHHLFHAAWHTELPVGKAAKWNYSSVGWIVLTGVGEYLWRGFILQRNVRWNIIRGAHQLSV